MTPTEPPRPATAEEKDQFLASLNDFVEEMYERGLELPWLCELTGSNGGTMKIRYFQGSNGIEADVLHIDGTLSTPIDMSLVDAAGETVRVTIEHEET